MCTPRNYFFFDNFSSGVTPDSPTSPYAIFFGGNDGVATASKNNLTVNSSPFILNQDGVLNHVKYLAYYKEPFVAPQDGADLVYESVISTEQTFSLAVPFPYAVPGTATGVQNKYQDLRLCSSALNVVDLETFMVFDTFFTDEDIYAFYERLPFIGGGKHAFSHAIPIGKRDRTDNVKISFAYNYKAGTAKWYINNELKFTVNRIGFPIDRRYRLIDHGGTAELVRPKSLYFGFGNFTLLDGYNPVNLPAANNMGLVDLASGFKEYNPLYTDLDGLPLDAEFIGGPKIFGQGANFTLRYFSVYETREIVPSKVLGIVTEEQFDSWGVLEDDTLVAQSGVPKPHRSGGICLM